MKKDSGILNHIAFIMDGNRRWAKQNKRTVLEGHKEGAKVMAKLIQQVFDMKIPFVSVYAFSLDNWKRDPLEIQELHVAIHEFCDRDLDQYKSKKIRVCFSGVNDLLDSSILKSIRRIQEETKSFENAILNICFNYSSRRDIVEATKKIAQEVLAEKMSLEKLNIETFKHYLSFPDIPDVDLLIRTSDEHRISDFLLYESAYAELYFTDILWPDMTIRNVQEAIDDFGNRKRRFGGN